MSGSDHVSGGSASVRCVKFEMMVGLYGDGDVGLNSEPLAGRFNNVISNGRGYFRFFGNAVGHPSMGIKSSERAKARKLVHAPNTSAASINKKGSTSINR